MPLIPFANNKETSLPVVYYVELLSTCNIDDKNTVTIGGDYFLLKVNRNMLMITDLERWSCVELRENWDHDYMAVVYYNGPVLTELDRDFIASHIVNLTP